MTEFHDRMTVSVQVGNRTTVAKVKAWIDHDPKLEGYEFVGEARCHPDDKFDPEVGTRLALGRALESAGKRFQRQADGLVRMHEHNRNHKPSGLRQEIHDTLNRVAQLKRNKHNLDTSRLHHEGLELYRLLKSLLERVEKEGVCQDLKVRMGQEIVNIEVQVFGLDRKAAEKAHANNGGTRQFMDCGSECNPQEGHARGPGCILYQQRKDRQRVDPETILNSDTVDDFVEELNEVGRRITRNVRKAVKEIRDAMKETK